MHIILNTLRTYLLIENGHFVIINDEGIQIIFPEIIRSIHITQGASINSDAALLALKHKIDVVFTEKTGMFAGRIVHKNLYSEEKITIN
jgi:CRISPR-associated protein Cas1